VPSGILYVDRDPGKGAVKKLHAEWLQARRDNRRPAVLAGAKYEQISVSPEESQFLGTVDANVQAIARLYGVPPEMVGGSTAGPLAYTSPEMRSLDLLTYTVRGGWSGWRTPSRPSCPPPRSPGSTPEAWSGSTSRAAMRPTRSPSGPGSSP
jgi:phage portal protein BeeE